MGTDYRHQMLCQDCWAFSMDRDPKPGCLISMQDTNRPESFGEIPRTKLTVFQQHLLKDWPCEFRYTKEEVEKMKSGDYKGAHVIKQEGIKIVKKVSEV